MSFKSLIIFALVASIGRVMAAPLADKYSGARSSCQGAFLDPTLVTQVTLADIQIHAGISCPRFIVGSGHSGLSRRLAEFDGGNVTLSSGKPNLPTTSVDLPSSTLSVDPSSTPSVDPSSTSSVDGPPTETPRPTKPYNGNGDGDGGKPPSSTSDGNPEPTDPAAGDPVIVTITTTIFVDPTDPATSLPTQSPASSSVLSSSLAINPSSTISGNPPSFTPINPSATLPGGSIISSPGLVKPSGMFTSVSSPAPLISPTIIELTNGVPSSSASSNPASQPTPSATRIIFLPGP